MTSKAIGSTLFVLLLAFRLLHLSASEPTVWPLPAHQVDGTKELWFRPSALRVRITGAESDILEASVERFWGLLSTVPLLEQQRWGATSSRLCAEALCEERSSATNGLMPRSESRTGGVPDCALDNHKGRRRIRSLVIHVRDHDQSLGLHTDERYLLSVAAPHIRLEARTVFGALHGLESLAQLVSGQVCHAAEFDGPEQDTNRRRKKRRKRRRGVVLRIKETNIRDEPRFPHRGLLIDTGRHFLSLTTIKAHVDAMAASKLNVLHWHIVDDQSFPYGSAALPALPLEGAFSPRQVYSLEDIADVVLYARVRGVRVYPEFDTPGHTLSWGAGEPGLLAACYDGGGRLEPGTFGPIDATRPAAYGLMWTLLREVSLVFPDSMLHLGGDEVDPACWESNPDIRRWMRRHGRRHDAAALQQRWGLRLQGLALALGRVPVLWEEAFYPGDGAALDRDAVVQVWKWWKDAAVSGTNATRPPLCAATDAWGDRGRQLLADVGGAADSSAWQDMLERVTAAGHKALLSAPWYLNLGTFAGRDWRQYYEANPGAFKPSQSVKQYDLILGGEACLWGEFIDDTNALQRAWPAAAAVAERLWSPHNLTDSLTQAEPRLVEHRCRLVARGIPAVPLDPGTCAPTLLDLETADAVSVA